MIHIHGRDKHEWLTDDQFKAQHPALHAAISAPRPFNEGGEKVKKLRQKYGLTVMELARRAGIKLGDLSAIETGRIEPTGEQLDAIGLAVSNLTPLPKCTCGAKL